MKYYFKSSSNNRSKNGFTLLELMVVIAIVSTLSVWLFKGIFIAKSNLDLNMAAQQLAATLKECQSCAMYTGSDYKVEFYPSINRYRVFCDYNVIKDVQLGNIILHYTNFTIGRVRFYSLGTPSMGGTVTLKTKYGKTLYVIMTPVTARVRISDKPPANW
ncbi:MAG: GspH/FimT family protein [Atribacterota bacterium]